MNNFCSKCGNMLTDAEKGSNICTNCSNIANAQNNNSTKKVRFHWEIPFILFIQYVVFQIINIVINIVNSTNNNECIENCETVLSNIFRFLNLFSIILAIFIVPSFIAVLIIYLVRKNK